MKNINIKEFLEAAEEVPVVDVRTPDEYNQGHITGAYNLPLFSNEERVVVGTLYKKSGKEAAVLEGLKYVGPKMHDFIIQLRKIVRGKSKKVIVHCWRGGMRSQSMVWLFNMAGFDACWLEGGYKAYRSFIREDFSSERKLIVLGGYTGSGKTEILKRLEQKGEQIIDLEGLANHKGSVYGGLGQEDQPTNEQFENDTWTVWNKLDSEKPVWIEDESRSIGKVGINNPLYMQMFNSDVIFVDLPIEERINRLKKEYAIFDIDNLMCLSSKIQKKLGGNNLKELISSLENGDFENAIRISLKYYDKAYLKGLEKKTKVYKIETETISDEFLEGLLKYKSLVF